MKEKYYLVSKETAQRAGLNNLLRTEVDGMLALSEKDLRNISLTIEERAVALDAVPYVEPTNKSE